MGVVNVTPDSFSDGGEYLAPATAAAHAFDLIDQGADIIDIGPESTRPGSLSVSADEQIARAVPVIEIIRRKNDRIPISIDTCLAPVARAALDAGADIVNDISALRHDPAMLDCVLEADAAVILMHMRGNPANMQAADAPRYDDVVDEITSFLEERRAFALNGGIAESRIIFDPGIGFGKRLEDNLEILNHVGRFAALGQPLLIGASRKSFIYHALGIEDPKDRLAASLACAAVAALDGASIVRTHDVRETVDVARMCHAIRMCRG